MVLDLEKDIMDVIVGDVMYDPADIATVIRRVMWRS